MKTRPEMSSLSDGQRDALDAIVKWHADGGWPPLTLGGLAGSGKALANGSRVQTPDGPRPIESLQPGDLVFGCDGFPVKVTGVFPQGQRGVFTMTFRDKMAVTCDGDHSWTLQQRMHGQKYITKTTRELLGQSLANNAGSLYTVPLCDPVEYPEKDLPVDPYLLGALIGDGTRLGGMPVLCLGYQDTFIGEECARRAPDWATVHSIPRQNPHVQRVQFEDRGPGYRNRLGALLTDFGLAVKSPERFIPRVYLEASVQQRWDLLRGLMDTDGTSRGNRCEFWSESPRLIQGVTELVQSLGGIAVLRGHGKDLNVKVFECPFLTPRKVAGWSLSWKNPPSRALISVEPAGVAECTCISVEAEDGLFLTDSFITTHNTTLAGLLPDVLPGREIAYVAYTGKAVSVLASKLPASADRVTTIHKLLYQPAELVTCAGSSEMLPGKAVRCHAHLGQEAECLAVRQVSFTPVADPLAGLDLVVADEASMIPERLWQDLTSHGVPVLAIGDHGQLPPVKSSFNLMADPDLRLEEIHRQAAGSPILAAARWAREQGHIPHGWYGQDVIKIKPHELGYAGLHPSQADLIICATNATRQFHNNAMRSWHGRSGPPQAGDVVICLRNNYDQGLFNGQRGVVLEHSGAWDEQDYRMTIKVDGLEAPWKGPVAAAPFGQLPSAVSQVRNRDLAVFDYGYAITGHKCADDATLILTRSGWKAHADLVVGEQVLTLNPDTQLSEWQPVLDIHRYQVADEQLLSIEAESHSSLSTLNHRWPAKDYRGRIVFTDSRYLYENPANYPSLAKAALHSGFPDVPKYSDAFVELVAWFWTEGHILSNKGGQIGAVTLTQSETANPENVARIRAALLAEIGLPRPRLGRYQDLSPAWTESWRHPGGAHRDNPGYRYWRFGLNNAAGQSLQEQAPGMILRPDFILALTRSQLELFIHVSMLGDGHTEHVGGQPYGVIRQKDRRWLEGFQFACTLAGYSTVMRQTPGNGMWWMRLKTGQFLHPRVLSSRLVTYTGTVWCPETANGTWFAKRNETTYFTGNSQGSQADNVIVIEESWPDPGTDLRRRWLYTCVTRAVKALTVVGW